ncbi:MAG: chorismate mutase [Syntrophomonadaceae bacterium]|jgi:chorismate mutase|nr:chorismate mutase [Syntrophomonadaceae bacterium]
MLVRGIRGATTVAEDKKELVLEAAYELLLKIQQENDFNPEDIVSVLLTVTPDIKSVFPAEARKRLGWDLVPLMCFQEIPVENALPLCIRVLVHFNCDKKQSEINHVYLKNAVVLRRDLVNKEEHN